MTNSKFRPGDVVSADTPYEDYFLSVLIPSVDPAATDNLTEVDRVWSGETALAISVSGLVTTVLTARGHVGFVRTQFLKKATPRAR